MIHLLFLVLAWIGAASVGCTVALVGGLYLLHRLDKANRNR